MLPKVTVVVPVFLTVTVFVGPATPTLIVPHVSVAGVTVIVPPPPWVLTVRLKVVV